MLSEEWVNTLKSRVSEISVKRIRVNQGVGVHILLAVNSCSKSEVMLLVGYWCWMVEDGAACTTYMHRKPKGRHATTTKATVVPMRRRRNSRRNSGEKESRRLQPFFFFRATFLQLTSTYL